jgi:hypothetical protein
MSGSFTLLRQPLNLTLSTLGHARIFVAATLVILALIWLIGFLYLSRRQDVMCPECGGKNAVTPDAENSRLVVLCQEADCGRTTYLAVRASALSLFGVTQLLLTLLAAVLGYKLGLAVGFDTTGRWLIAFAALVLGRVLARFIVLMVVFALLRCKPSPAWQKEIVAHLAPPPWKRTGPR